MGAKRKQKIWSGALMLEHLGEQEDIDAVLRGMEKILENGPKTPEIDGCALTQEAGGGDRCSGVIRDGFHLDMSSPLWLIPRSARATVNAVGPWVSAAWPLTARARGNPAEIIIICICPFV
jgi:hypothetical protein